MAPIHISHAARRTHSSGVSGGMTIERRRHQAVTCSLRGRRPGPPTGGLCPLGWWRPGWWRLVIDGDHLVPGVVAPWRRGAVADTDRNHRERRPFRGPGRFAIADHHQQIDRPVIDEPFNARANV